MEIAVNTSEDDQEKYNIENLSEELRKIEIELVDFSINAEI